MFATATRNFVEEVDPGGLLIPVRSLNDTIALLTVVVSQKRFWFWQKPKYLPTDFTLNDILTGDTPITPVLTETDFIKYNGTYGDNIQGTLDATFIHSNMNMEGKDSSKLQFSFGSLKKDEIDVRRFLQDSKNRVLDMSHCLIQQTKKKRQVFGVVKERIVTSQPCSVIEEVQQAGQCSGTLSFCGPKTPKVSLKDNGSLSKDSNVTMEIPTNTTLAYALVDLEVKHDGRYELCLMSVKGGFEVDSPTQKGLVGVAGAPEQNNPDVSHLRQELENLYAHFQLLAALPASSRSSLLKNITALIEDKAALSALQSVLDQMLVEESGNVTDVSDEHKQSIQPVLDVLKEAERVSAAPKERHVSLLSALHLITSALDELTCDSLAALSVCSSPDVLKIMELLVKCLSGSGESPASGADINALPEDVLSGMQQLFASSGVNLQRDGDTARSQINQLQHVGNRPLIVCIALRGLHSLACCV
ncbi:gasdermin Eb isoform X1 [Syngnathus acus]|uniref:gasdermin Eb isoform X1 n=1 Tax=Syngnathus acus TaxID=161584 RepID=UPI001886248F|nr:gasdermin Eb isoform X1 [Syngnathus acus]XP_037130339.1 gasdermin Eb isoform X1 [Syngnathus acus]